MRDSSLLSNKKVLLVDDDRLLAEVYSSKLIESGCLVTIAPDATTALCHVDERGLVADICLIDVIMPGLDGFGLIEELRRRPQYQKAAVIILSNLGEREDIERSLRQQVDGYIVKSCATPAEVVTRIAEIISTKNV